MGMTSRCISFFFPRHTSTKVVAALACFTFIIVACTHTMLIHLTVKGGSRQTRNVAIMSVPSGSLGDIRTIRKEPRGYLRLKSESLFRNNISNINLPFTNVTKSKVRKSLNFDYSDSIQFNLLQSSCVLPIMDVSEPAMMEKVKKPSCERGHPSWFKVANGSIVFSPEVLRLVGNITCDYTPLLRVDYNKDGNEKLAWGESVGDIPNGFRFPHDTFRIGCQSKTRLGMGQKPRQYTQIMHGVADKKWPPPRHVSRFAHRTIPAPELNSIPTSVLVLGFASMSRMSWLRRMRKTRRYFLHSLHGIELNGYHTMGDDSAESIISLLTGKTSTDVARDRKSRYASRWLWDDFSTRGYVTSLAMSDAGNLKNRNGLKDKRLDGLKGHQTDYSLRPFYLGHLDGNRKTDATNTFCTGDVPKHVDWLRRSRDLFDMHAGKRPLFMFHFYRSLSLYNDNDIMLADDDIEEFLIDMHRRGHLNNTVLVLMSDRGSSAPDVTFSWFSKLEERLPYMAFSFPPWFHQTHPQMIQALKTNVHRLTTPFDVYETLKTFASHNGSDGIDVQRHHSSSARERRINLFAEVPRNRTCSQATIKGEWCACLDRHVIPTNHTTARAAVFEVLTFLNELVFRNKLNYDLCLKLYLAKIYSANRWASNRKMVLSTSHGYHHDNLNWPGFSEEPEEDGPTLPMQTDYYHVTFSASRSHGRFEAIVTHNVGEDSMLVQRDSIRRIFTDDNDDTSSRCLRYVDKKVREFCVCSN